MRPALMNKEVTWNFRPLDVDKMQQGANYLAGEHDFSSFRAAGCQAHSPVRQVHHVQVYAAGDYVVLEERGDWQKFKSGSIGELFTKFVCSQ